MYRTFKTPHLGLIGAGVLAEALAKGFVASGSVQINQIYASAPTEREIHKVKHLGCQTSTDNVKLVQDNQYICLVVKPQVLPKVLKEISPHITKDHLLMSFAAGMKLRTIQYLLPPETRLARLMTNTPIQFREGVTSFCLGTHCTEEDRKFVNGLMNAVGYCTEVKEDHMDVVTGFAGGGPAYTYSFIEAIADGAVLGGMDRQQAIKMAAKTVLGAAKMLEETGKHPGELKDAVCSGGGSTIFGIHAMERSGMRGSVIDAVKAASDRSKELGNLINTEATNGS